ncbi:hypothetical protein [Acutalibacter sp. 1XD8-33]|uniref:hypothetical protein n=1 Tax=Acutalibacter sp. 1XD8-33 TaxID=2320081 RepID=UPI001A9C0D44|nr:hypothetical protein [Acutalibacter sp. 1XD8-33]
MGKKPRSYAVFCISKAWISKVPKRGCKNGLLALRQEVNPHNNRIGKIGMAAKGKLLALLLQKHIADRWRATSKISDRLFNFQEEGASNDQGKNHRKG